MQHPEKIGRYEIRGEIGRGAFAVVLRAWDPALDSTVAIKLLLSARSGAKERFQHEARLLRRVASPSVISVHDVGETDAGHPYFVADFADRGSLRERLDEITRQTTVIPDEQLRRLADAIGDGLSALHDAGLIHRDIKPANVLIASTNSGSTRSNIDNAGPLTLLKHEERALLGDLGIAKDVAHGTREASIVGGTPYYLAPEQNQSDARLSFAADTYAATAVLWNVLTGRLPPVPGQLHQVLSDVEERWHGFIEQGLNPDPAERFQTAAQWQAAVRTIMPDADGTTVVLVSSDRELASEVCPYKGLSHYTRSDAAFFCGREELTTEIVNRLQLHHALVVGGASGSGKSSLVRAGVLPALANDALPGSGEWMSEVVTPVSLSADAQSKMQLPVPENVPDGTEILFVIDQFEEVFTQLDENQRRLFLDHLHDLMSSGSGLRLLIVVRADFYGDCASEPWLARCISDNQVLVGPMTAAELRKAITEPARKAGLSLEKGLVEAVLEECGHGAGSMPLMSHALVETWVRRHGRTLTLAGLRACGGVMGAISQTADLIYDTKFTDVQREFTRQVMLRLVSPGINGPDTRRVVEVDDLKGDSEPELFSGVMQQLTLARLIRIDEDRAQIAHEALLSGWPRLREWISESHQDLRTRQRIVNHAQDWQLQQCDDDLLYRGTPLLTAMEWFNANPRQLGATAQEFLHASQAMQVKQEEERTSRQRYYARLRRISFIGLTLLSICTTVASVFAIGAWKESRRNAELAMLATAQANARFVGALGATALANVGQNPRLSLVLAAEAMHRARDLTAGSVKSFDSRSAMVSARQRLARGGPFIYSSPIVAGSALSIALNPQGSVLVIGGLDGSITFVDPHTQDRLQVVDAAHSNGVRDIEFSRNGRLMATSGADGRLLIWRRQADGSWDHQELWQSTDVIPDVDFHPDGKSVISANDDGTIRRWALDESGSTTTIAINPIGFNAVAISPDGIFVAAGNADKSVMAWSLVDGSQVMKPITGLHSSHLVDLAFLTDGKSLVTLTTDGESKQLSFPDGEDLGLRFAADYPIGAMMVDNATGQLIAGTLDGRLVERDAASDVELHRSAPGHTQIIRGLAVTRDFRLIATLGRDQVIRLWTINDRFQLAEELEIAGSAIRAVSWSSDGRMLAAGDKKGRLRLWTLEPSLRHTDLNAHDKTIWSLAFSADSNRLASGDKAGNIIIWDTASARIAEMHEVGGGAVWALAYSADGNAVYAVTSSSVIRYDIARGSHELLYEISDGEFTRFHLDDSRSAIFTTSNTGVVREHSLADPDSTEIVAAENDIVWSATSDEKQRLLVTASGSETVSIYNLSDGQMIDSLTGHTGGATNVAFIGDGRTLVVSDRNGSLHWWDIESLRRLAAPWPAHRKVVWRMAVHPQKNRFATAGDDGVLRIWSLLNVDSACDIGFPGFDNILRQRYFGEYTRPLVCER